MTNEPSICDIPASDAGRSSPVLWRVFSSGRVRIAPNRPYWYDNRWRAPRDTVIFQASLAGRIVFQDQQTQHVVEPGQFLMFAFGEATAYGLPPSQQTGYENQWLSLQGAGLLDHYHALRQQLGPVFSVRPASALIDRMTQLARLGSPQANTVPHVMANACYDFMLSLLEQAEQRLYQTLTPTQRAVEHILRRPLEPLSIEQLAHRFGCSREHLTRLFRQRVGQSPAFYMTKAKLKRAAYLLTQTDLPLKSVAEQAGFVSVAALGRHIRCSTGITPLQLRHRAITGPKRTAAD